MTDIVLACAKEFAIIVSKETPKSGTILYTDNTPHAKITKELLGSFDDNELIVSSNKKSIGNKNKKGYYDLTVEKWSINIVASNYRESIRAIWLEYDCKDNFKPELMQLIEKPNIMSSAIFALTLKPADNDIASLQNKLNTTMNLDSKQGKRFNATVIRTKYFASENKYFVVYRLTQAPPITPNQECPPSPSGPRSLLIPHVPSGPSGPNGPRSLPSIDDGEETDIGSDSEIIEPPTKKQKTTSLGSQVLAMESRLNDLETIKLIKKELLVHCSNSLMLSKRSVKLLSMICKNNLKAQNKRT